MQEAINKLKQACKERSLRYTMQREKVFLAVYSVKNHPDVKAVYETVKKEMPEISMDTVYRNLQALEEMHLIFRVDNNIPMARFDADLREHMHFICSKCGAVIDIPVDSEFSIPKAANGLGEISNINLQVIGICNSCKEKK